MRTPIWSAALCLGIVAACGGPNAGEATRTGETGAATLASAAMAPPAGSAAGAADLERAARHVVGFLRAEIPRDSVALADSVELRVTPEGGGATRRLSREALRDVRAWTIGEGTRRVRLIPPADYAAVTTAVGRHYRCQEQALAPLAPEWAHRPHVGVRLQPREGVASCLQSWNATFVFDTAGGTPRLLGVLYDQWEW